VSTLLHATVYMFLHNLLNVLVQIANKMGLQKKNKVYKFLESQLQTISNRCRPDSRSSFVDRHTGGSVLRIPILDYTNCSNWSNEHVCTFTHEEKFNKQQNWTSSLLLFRRLGFYLVCPCADRLCRYCNYQPCISLHNAISRQTKRYFSPQNGLYAMHKSLARSFFQATSIYITLSKYFPFSRLLQRGFSLICLFFNEHPKTTY
jgi:hypothetical protein